MIRTLMILSNQEARLTVLIVEDEPLLRLFATEMIEDAGFDVVSAATGVDALSVLDSDADIDIVFTDVDMPGGVDGIELAARILDKWPLIKIIITSGKPVSSKNMIPSEAIFFSKPYRRDRIIETLQKMAL